MREKKGRQPEYLSASLSGRSTTPEPIGTTTDDGKLIPHPGHIVIRPAIPEWEESASDYEEFIDALGERGIDVELAEIKASHRVPIFPNSSRSPSPYTAASRSPTP